MKIKFFSNYFQVGIEFLGFCDRVFGVSWLGACSWLHAWACSWSIGYRTISIPNRIIRFLPFHSLQMLPSIAHTKKLQCSSQRCQSCRTTCLICTNRNLLCQLFEHAVLSNGRINVVDLQFYLMLPRRTVSCTLLAPRALLWCHGRKYLAAALWNVQLPFWSV